MKMLQKSSIDVTLCEVEVLTGYSIDDYVEIQKMERSGQVGKDWKRVKAIHTTGFVPQEGKKLASYMLTAILSLVPVPFSF